VRVPPSSPDEALEIFAGLKGHCEKHHTVRFSEDATFVNGNWCWISLESTLGHSGKKSVRSIIKPWTLDRNLSSNALHLTVRRDFANKSITFSS